MSIPTPSAIGPRLTERKQHEMQLEAERTEQIAALEDKLKKASGQKHEKTVQNNRARFGSKGSRSFPQGKGQGTSSKSVQKPQSTDKSTSSITPSASSKELETESSSSTSIPSTPQSSSSPKKPFVRKEHLTQRLSSNEQLRELRDTLNRSRHGNRNSSRKSATATSSKKK